MFFPKVLPVPSIADVLSKHQLALWQWCNSPEACPCNAFLSHCFKAERWPYLQAVSINWHFYRMNASKYKSLKLLPTYRFSATCVCVRARARARACVCVCVWIIETFCHDELHCCSLFYMKFKQVGMVKTPFLALIVLICNYLYVLVSYFVMRPAALTW